jgi:hypothetical protein
LKFWELNMGFGFDGVNPLDMGFNVDGELIILLYDA